MSNGNSKMFKFDNTELSVSVNVLANADGSLSINAEDTAIGFGWYKDEKKKGKMYRSIRWKRMNEFSKEFGFDHEWSKGQYMPESLFYRLAMKANNEIANKFQNWLANEVIPQIRKTGGYIPTVVNTTPLTDDQIMAQALIIAQRTIETRNQELAVAKQMINQKEAELIIANDKVQVLTPKAEYYDDVLQAKNLITTTDIAKYDYGISAVALNKILCEWKIQYKKGNRYYLYAKYDGLGYTGSRTTNWKHTDGSPGASINMMWTQKGRKMIYNEMNAHGILTLAEKAQSVLDTAII